MTEISSTCPYCGVGCGVTVSVNEETNVPLIVGDPAHPANYGRLCSKGSALGETLLQTNEAVRLTQPMLSGKPVSWNSATDVIAREITSSIEKFGRESVAFYLSGQLLTEDYYVANKLMKGFIGTANVDTNSRLCMSSAVAGYKRAFGSDTVPCNYEDLDHADLIVLIGSNAAWTHPVLFQRMAAAKKANPALQIVLVDPRVTATETLADLHLQLVPSSDGYLFQGLLKYLVENDKLNQPYIDANTEGFEGVADDVQSIDWAEIVATTGLDLNRLKTFYQLFADCNKAVSFYSQGINQSATGTDKCNSIINCHLATGKMGYPGAGPFSITGQPNAMGGREVGGLANQLAAHMDFAPQDVDRVQRFWQSPRIARKPGLKAVELFNAVDSGQIKVLWIMATNPAVSIPDSARVRRALARCPVVIVSDITHTDTTQFAKVLLPVAGWGEKDGTVTNSERRISRQRAFRNPPGSAKPDWWAVSEVARKLGYEKAFDYRTPLDIFVEHAALSGYENNGMRGFDISALSTLNQTEYDALVPTQWPITHGQRGGTSRMLEDGAFFTPSGKAQFVCTTPTLAPCSTAEFVLNTGRLRDQWHTMTRTGTAPALTAHDDIPFTAMHPDDAKEKQLRHNQFIEIQSKSGAVITRLDISNRVTRGQLFQPIHWTDQYATSAIVSNVVSPETDPISGQPESKASAVSVRAFDCAYWARIASADRIPKTGWRYWAETKSPTGYIYLVGNNKAIDWRQWLAKNVLGMPLNDTHEITRYVNPIEQTEVVMLSADELCSGFVYSSSQVENLPGYVWIETAFARAMTGDKGVLRGEPGLPDTAVCSCFRTSKTTIVKAIKDGSMTLDLLAQNLGCTANCGSCRPEVSQILSAESAIERNDRRGVCHATPWRT